MLSSAIQKSPVTIAEYRHAVLDVWAHIHPRFGGVGPAAAALARAVTENSDWGATQLATCLPTEDERADDIPSTVRTVIPSGPRPLKDVQVARSVEAAVRSCDVCHVHGIWASHAISTRRVARRFNKPVVSSAHGMLERWELANKAGRKAFYSAFLERPSLATSACMRALSTQEAQDYRSYGLRNPIAIVPNGIAPLERIDTSALLYEYPQLRQKQVVLFLSRVHEKKGILQLALSWPSVVKRNPDAHLLIAGSEYGEAGIKARQILEESKCLHNVTFAGLLSGSRKLAALSLATCFCLPSLSEGMSIAVLEALSIGAPVVISPACNVDGVLECNAGLITSSNASEISSKLSHLLTLSPARWQQMSNSARALARSRHSWSKIGSSMSAVYDWVVGGREPNLFD